MLRKRSFTVFVVAFLVVLVGGVALAQVGTFATPGAPAEEPPQSFVAEPATTTTVEMDEPGPDPAGEYDAEKPKPVEEAERVKDGAPETGGSGAKEEHDTTAPAFAILFPEDGHHTDDVVQVFEGHVEPGAVVTRGKYEADVDGEGWRIELVLSPGKNVVTLVATDAAGNVAKDTVTVWLDGQDEDKPEEEKADAVAFTAQQKFGSCGDEVPYDVFFGTATPGATIHVVSPYGSRSTVAGEKGKWDVKVEFPTAPAGEVFEVVVESSDGGRKVFTFVNTGGEHDG